MNVVHGFNTGKYRKAAKMPYPITYASNEEAAKDVKGKPPPELSSLSIFVEQ